MEKCETVKMEGYIEGVNSVNTYDDDLKATSYQKGLKDTCEAAETIFNMSPDEINECFDFCSGDPKDVFELFASEVISKIKAYEEQKKAKEEIKIDDEIYSEMTNTKAVVTFVDSWGRWQCLSGNGFFVIDDDRKKYWVKTGRHFDIDGILKAMREE